MQRLLIVGAGDIAERLLPLLRNRYRLYALVRSRARANAWRALGVTPLLADLDARGSLGRLTGLADVVLHLAPPPAQGGTDKRTQALIAALSAGRRPRQIVYISTTGVYGDCAGACIDETRRVLPESARAGRRVDAERQLRRFGRHAARVSILRAPGIYAAERLPVDRLRAGLPALQAEVDTWTNHIHAEDLARAVVAALRRGRANRVVNVVDDSDLRMGDYFDKVADRFGLPRPPRVSAAEARARLSPVQWSFLRESRRIGNARLKRELQLRLHYPTVDDGLAAAISLPPCLS